MEEKHCALKLLSIMLNPCNIGTVAGGTTSKVFNEEAVFH